MDLLLSLFIGLVTALIGSIAGLGGGVILVPSLLFLGEIMPSFDWVTPQKIVGISLVVMIFTGLSSTITYIRHKRVDIRVGLLMLIGSIPGGIIGSYINQYFKSDAFSLFFGIVMILVSLMFFIRKKDKSAVFKTGENRSMDINGQEYAYSFPIAMGIVLAFAVGILSGLLGIGGGSLIVPAMILLLGFPPHIATATSMFMIFFASVSSSATHIVLGHVDWNYALVFIPGAYVGGMLGARLNRKLKSQSVEWFLRVLLILIGIRLVWQGLG
ncbi:sulfite exporter TauE/SafE family protein [Thalassobacillus sp. CUG 92003]|uniref:sulfite exporter TauE/SafE family protein n=1 Tax=Thalassobacillus sp. CUG 92003 TaxID=2736641 RepID=UPI0015E6729B|nr:sulfite exporter TauE/SafE family protein [Thalassobacillus sp. CUG 92003]